MKIRPALILIVPLGMILAADLFAAQWLHIRVKTENDVSVDLNLPLGTINGLLNLIDDRDHQRRKIHFHSDSFDYDELYRIWQDLRADPSRSIERRRQRFSREGNSYVIRSSSRWTRWNRKKTEVLLPAAMVDALFRGSGHFDLEAAMQAFAEEGSGEVVEVRVGNGETRVQIWIDESKS